MEEGSQEPQQWQPEEEQAAYPSVPSVSWSASEFISHQKASIWYVGLGVGGAITTIVVYLIARNIFSAVVIATACIVIGVFAARQPETKQYEVNEQGVKVGDKFFPYSTFKSFSIVEEGAVACLWLRPLKRYMPTVAMYYAPEDEERILMTLENFLPEEERKQDLFDRASRRIRF